MTFGQIKSIIENNLVQSYNNEGEFKKLLKEFKYYVLNDKSLSKLYTLYDQLSSPQNLTEDEAKEFLSEGITLIQSIASTVKLPKTLGSVPNQYGDIDSLVYSSKVDIKERVEAKKNLLKTLMKESKTTENAIQLPIETMVKIANTTLNQYVHTLDENSKKDFFNLISESPENLQSLFIEKKQEALSKLNTMFKSEINSEVKQKLSETIEKIETSEFDHLNLLKLQKLVNSI